MESIQSSSRPEEKEEKAKPSQEWNPIPLVQFSTECPGTPHSSQVCWLFLPLSSSNPSSLPSQSIPPMSSVRPCGIKGDGRCLFRSVAHGAYLRSGKPSPSENLQKQLADELRSKVVDEFIKRRADTEWFLESDFDTYITQMRLPHVWGGEPELLMCSHVLEMPITVYMYNQNPDSFKITAEYGQEYGKDNPIRVLYHSYGHYEALQIPVTRTSFKGYSKR